VITQNDNSKILEQNGTGGAASPSAVSETVAMIVWRGRWIVLLSTAALIAAAIIYIVNATPIFMSTSRIYVEQSGPRIVSELEEGVMTQSKNYLYTQAELLRSTPILSAAIEKPGIKDFRMFFGKANPLGFLKQDGLEIEVCRRTTSSVSRPIRPARPKRPNWSTPS